MSSIAVNHQSDEAAVEPKAIADDGIPWGVYFKVIMGIAVVYFVSRVYMHAFAYTMGLDYFEPE